MEVYRPHTDPTVPLPAPPGGPRRPTLAAVTSESTSSAAEAAEALRVLLGAPAPADSRADTPPGDPLPRPEAGRTAGRARWRCEHCGWETEAWVRPECARCYTMSTQAIAWVDHPTGER